MYCIVKLCIVFFRVSLVFNCKYSIVYRIAAASSVMHSSRPNLELQGFKCLLAVCVYRCKSMKKLPVLYLQGFFMKLKHVCCD